MVLSRRGGVSGPRGPWHGSHRPSDAAWGEQDSVEGRPKQVTKRPWGGGLHQIFDRDKVEQAIKALVSAFGRSLFGRRRGLGGQPALPMDDNEPTQDAGVEDMPLLDVRVEARRFVEREGITLQTATRSQRIQVAAALDQAVRDAVQAGCKRERAQIEFFSVLVGRRVSAKEAQELRGRLETAANDSLSVIRSVVYMSIDPTGQVSLNGMTPQDMAQIEEEEGC